MVLNDKCTSCANWFQNLEQCKFCHYEFDNERYWCNDEKWDILELDDDVEWSHLQILYRLHSKGIECLSADIWFDSNMAFLIGVKASDERVARALGINKDSIYNDFEHGMMLLNLFKEKCYRKYSELREDYDRAVKAGMSTGGIIGELNTFEKLLGMK